METQYSVEVGGRKSFIGAREHACGKLITEMVEKGIYPRPEDFDQVYRN